MAEFEIGTVPHAAGGDPNRHGRPLRRRDTSPEAKPQKASKTPSSGGQFKTSGKFDLTEFFNPNLFFFRN